MRTKPSGQDAPMAMSSSHATEPIPLPYSPPTRESSPFPEGAGKDDDGMLALPAGPSVVPGVIGLQNIGNTCFMNSVLQCLLHCRPLCEYFQSGRYKEEINESNPLGSGGKLVNEFARLVERFWLSPSDRVVTPRDLKWVIGQHAPMFVGYQQQDSQELVTFLLDGLHEDLNLVKNKPYTEAIEANDRPDALVASLCWDQHLLRNKSVIVDIFQGQYKSRLRCPHCSKSSVTFDPFMYLSLPIPSHPDLPLLVTFSFPQQEQNLPPIRLAVNVFRDASDLAQAIAAAVSAELPAEYSDTLITDDVVVFSQSTTYSCFQEMDGTNFYATSSLAAKKRVFCSFAPRLLVSPADESVPKRQRNNAVIVAVQARICPKSKWVSPADSPQLDQPVANAAPSITPSVGYVPIGCPATVAVSNTATAAELLQTVKRTVLYCVGSRSKEVLEGLRSAIVRIVDNGATVASCSLSAALATSAPFVDLLVPSESKKVQLNIFVDIPVEEQTAPVDEGEDDMSIETPSWDDVVALIQGRVSDYYRTEKSWRLTSVLGMNSAAHPQQAVSIDDCFRLFASEEVLSAEDQWYCSTCKTHVQASKKIELWSLPEVLIIHLKRFQYARGFRNKIESTVAFPSRPDDLLDVAQYLPDAAVAASEGKSLRYKLFGVSNHTGSLYSGHYTAFASVWSDTNSPTQRRKDDQWFNFNDSFVSEMNSPPNPDPSAYLLFYHRV